MVYEVEDKVFFVTGAATGIGAEVVKSLVVENAKKIIVFDINEREGIALQNELNSKHGEKVKFIKGDVTNEDLFISNLRAVKEEYGLDVLINNAGIMNDSWEKYKKEIEINMLALVTGTLHGLKLMRKDEGGNGGTIINLASVAALTQGTLLPVYWATKSAVLQFSNCLGKDKYYSRTGVRILVLCPGRTETALIPNIHSFDPFCEASLEEDIEVFPSQKPESVSRALVEMYKRGKSGSTWKVVNDLPVQDITAKIDKAYEIMSGDD